MPTSLSMTQKLFRRPGHARGGLASNYRRSLSRRKRGRHTHLPPLLFLLLPVVERPFAIGSRRGSAAVVIGLRCVRSCLICRRLLLCHRSHSKRCRRRDSLFPYWMISRPIIPACCCGSPPQFTLVHVKGYVPR